jgi:hypothetical protein
MLTTATLGQGEPQQVESAVPADVRILFIGNSLTFYNNLPIVISQFYAAQNRLALTGQHTPGGVGLAQHADNPELARKIASQKWDFVVLQDQSALPQMNPQATLDAAKKLCELVRKAGATPVFYLTWGYPAKEPPGMNVEMQKALTRTYREAAEANNALLAPVGPAWQLALEKDPSVKLYMQNDYHPSPDGSYLAACVLYSVMSKRPPVGLPAKVTALTPKGRQTLISVPSARAKFYQQAAAEVLRDFKMAEPQAPQRP